MKIFSTKQEATDYAVSVYGKDMVEFDIAAPFKLADLICKHLNIDLENAGKFALTNEFYETYA
jgi:hypothetical protein